MRQVVKRVVDGVKRRLHPHPTIYEFASPMREEFKEQYTGELASLFFSSRGRLVHKWLHYLPIYESFLAPYVGTEVRMLEIGVSKGGSLELWRRYLGKDAVIFGVDIDRECAAYDGEAGRVRIGSQDDPAFLRSVVKEMGGVDIVLDDGSHVATHQRVSFDTLFPLLTEGGIYAIEDMHTAYWWEYEGGLRKKGTAIEYLKDRVDDLHRHYHAAGGKPADIESIQFYDSIAVVRKRQQLLRHHVHIAR